jgi:GntR family transcriptional regulator
VPAAPSVRLDTADPRPLWRQIEEGIRQAIALGSLRPGDAIPSVRDLARELRVNPNTVARSFQSLADSGVVVTRRGEGTFVADSQPTRPRREIAAGLAEVADRFAAAVITLGASPGEAVAAAEQALAKLAARKERNR